MNYYETLYILHPELSDEQSKQLQETLSKTVEKEKGIVHVVDEWGLKKLAYEVRKQRKGRYVLMQFAGTAATVRELERTYRVNEGVIKYMTLRIEKEDLKAIPPAAGSAEPAAAPAAPQGA